MSTAELLGKQEYKYGFVTDIESDVIPRGLTEDTIRLIVEKKNEPEFLGKGDGITTCLVTGESVDKELKFEVEGQTFYACCAGCIEMVKKNPAAYLKKTNKK